MKNVLNTMKSIGLGYIEAENNNTAAVTNEKEVEIMETKTINAETVTTKGLISIYTDGGCRDNQNKNNVGAYAYRLELGEHVMEHAEATTNTTNNIMELMAVIEALKTIKDTACKVVVYTDSAYVVGCATKWMKKWRNDGYNKKGGLANRKEIMALDEQVQRFEHIEFVKVKGHAGHAGNERVDKLLNIAMDEYQLTSNEVVETQEETPAEVPVINAKKPVLADILDEQCIAQPYPEWLQDYPRYVTNQIVNGTTMTMALFYDNEHNLAVVVVIIDGLVRKTAVRELEVIKIVEYLNSLNGKAGYDPATINQMKWDAMAGLIIK